MHARSAARLALTACKALAWYENIPLYSLLSISVYKRYYTFLVVYVLRVNINGLCLILLAAGTGFWSSR